MKYAKIAFVCIIGTSLVFAGCSSAKKSVTNKAALKIVDILDNEYNTNLKAAPDPAASSPQYCASTGASTATAFKGTEALNQQYRKLVESDADGTATADKFDKLRMSLKECAFVRCKAAVRGDTASIENIGKILGIEAGAQPSKQACADYEKLSTEIKSTLGQ